MWIVCPPEKAIGTPRSHEATFAGFRGFVCMGNALLTSDENDTT